jgi:hypothetical protein
MLETWGVLLCLKRRSLFPTSKPLPTCVVDWVGFRSSESGSTLRRAPPRTRMSLKPLASQTCSTAADGLGAAEVLACSLSPTRMTIAARAKSCLTASADSTSHREMLPRWRFGPVWVPLRRSWLTDQLRRIAPQFGTHGLNLPFGATHKEASSHSARANASHAKMATRGSRIYDYT